jgi:hypothetical protein
MILHLDPDPATQINADLRGLGSATPLFMAGSLEEGIGTNCLESENTNREVMRADTGTSTNSTRQ